MHTFYNIAVKYHTKGLPVIPVSGKIPMVKWLGGVPSPSDIKSIWQRATGIALLTGSKSGIVVVDVDSSEAVGYVKSMGVPKTWVSATRRGYHYFFKTSQIVKTIKLTKDIDIKAEGSIVILPPSKHPSGYVYKWVIDPSTIEPSPLPDWVLNAVKVSDDVTVKEILTRGVEKGARNISLARLVGFLFIMGLSYDEALCIVKKWNATNSPPLQEKEIVKTVTSIWERESRVRKKTREILETARTMKQILNQPDDVAKRITVFDLKKLFGIEKDKN